MRPASRTVSSSNLRSSDASGAGKCHALDADGGGVCAMAEFQVAGRRQAGEHVLEIAGDGDFGYWDSDLAIFDPETGGAAAVIAGHAIDTHAHQFGDIEALFDVGHQLRRGKLAHLQ